jgi:hypothetical protein
MREERLFVLVPEALRDQIVDWANDASTRRWSSLAEIVACKAGTTKLERDAKAKEVLRDFRSSGAAKLVVHRDCACSRRPLQESGVDHSWVDIHGIEKQLESHFRLYSSDAKGHALREWSKSGRQGLHPDAWVEQFVAFDKGWVGRALARQLQVITHADIEASMKPRRTDALWPAIRYCYYPDDDKGGSWLDIRPMLERNFPAHLVCPIKVAIEALKDIGGIVYLYEDGLWSGKEVTDRLASVSPLLREAAGRIDIRLRYSVVTDFGAIVCRHSIASEGLAGIQLDLTHDFTFLEFLPASVVARLGTLWSMTPDELSTHLHKNVMHAAFADDDLWAGRADEGKEFCRSVGGQLVRQWLVRDGKEATDERVKRFELGGGEFSSMVAFEESVPKVCLPLLWLDGDVVFGGTKHRWRPLFNDARRVEDARYFDF